MNFIKLSVGFRLEIENFFKMIEDQGLVDEFLDRFEIWEQLFFVVVSVLHERELTVDFVQLVFEVILKHEFL